MFVDTHCHINADVFKTDAAGYVKRAADAGVQKLIVVGWDVNSSRDAIKYAVAFPGVFAAVAIHPVDAVSTPLSDLDIIANMLTHPKVVALGEIGLDYHWIEEKDKQAIEHDFFIKQIALANAHQKPVIIHMRNATQDTYDILHDNRPLFGGVMHSYSGSVEMAKRFLDLGMYIGIGGPVTFKNAKEPKLVAAMVPSDKLLLETDAPYLAPHPFRGTTNESYHIPLIAETIAALRGISVDTLKAQTTKNAHTLFKL